MPAEVWKTIQEFPNYSVSSLGRVQRIVPDKFNRPPKILKGELNYAGYRMVTLFKEGNRQAKRVGRLVAFAFLEPDLFRTQVNHKNGNRSDDRAENLEWTTCSENHKHSFTELGRIGPRGELQGGAKLTTADVLQIRTLFTNGATDIEIAECFNVSRSTIYLIRKNRNWKHL
jgi:hypothetical protein